MSITAESAEITVEKREVRGGWGSILYWKEN
jgi:hypothetical protein